MLSLYFYKHNYMFCSKNTNVHASLVNKAMILCFPTHEHICSIVSSKNAVLHVAFRLDHIYDSLKSKTKYFKNTEIEDKLFGFR